MVQTQFVSIMDRCGVYGHAIDLSSQNIVEVGVTGYEKISIIFYQFIFYFLIA